MCTMTAREGTIRTNMSVVVIVGGGTLEAGEARARGGGGGSRDNLSIVLFFVLFVLTLYPLACVFTCVFIAPSKSNLPRRIDSVYTLNKYQ